jgi:putative phosphoribosyl transferase
MGPIFQDRREAGRELAELLRKRGDLERPIVLALPRGGVPVAAEIAAVLEAPLDVILVRKLGLPGQPELAMGAIASGGIRVLNPDLAVIPQVPGELVRQVTEREVEELARRERAYRGDRPRPDLRGRTVILVDDGLATGSSMLAAVAAVRSQGPERVLVAVPVAPPETLGRLEREVDEVICAATPEPFLGVGAWYGSFPQVSDQEVRELLENERPPASRA